jgi:hypothetical protein
VDRIGADKQKQENLFEFNLQKSGIEKEQIMGDTSDRSAKKKKYFNK